MKLKSLVLNILLFSFIIFFYLSFEIIDKFMKPQLLEIEKKYTLEQFDRTEKIISEDLESLQSLVFDWAIWDDTYDFIENINLEYIESNIVTSTFTDAHISFISMFDKNKKEIYSVRYDKDNNIVIDYPNYFINTVTTSDNGYFINYDSHLDELFFVAYSKTFDSNKEKKFNGYIMMGQILDKTKYNNLSERSGSKISFNIRPKKIDKTILKITQDHIYAEKSFQNLKNTNISLQTITKRWIGIIVLKLLNKTIFFASILFLLFFITTSIFIYFFAIKKIENFKSQVENLPLNDFKGKLKIKGSGEFKDLAKSINEMLYKIQKINMKVLLEKEKYEALFEETAAIHIIVDENYCIKEANKRLEYLLGFEKSTIIGKNILDAFTLKDRNQLKETIDNIFIGTSTEEIQVSLKDIHGDTKHLIITPSNFLLIEEEDKYRILLVGNDITEKKKIERKLKQYATLDELTGIYNRRIGIEMLDKNLFLAKRNKWNLIVAFIDVNGLKEINDNLGHTSGDNLIKTTAFILKKSIRKSDIVCRLGGDEFLVILSNCDWINVDDFWNRVLKNKKDINDSNKFKFKISLSHGFSSLSENNEITAFELIEIADKRMYENKLSKKAERKKEIE